MSSKNGGGQRVQSASSTKGENIKKKNFPNKKPPIASVSGLHKIGDNCTDGTHHVFCDSSKDILSPQ